MSHFLLALVVVALAVVVALEAWGHARGRGAPVAPRWLRVVALVGDRRLRGDGRDRCDRDRVRPPSGADDAVARLGLEIRDTVYVHVRATAVYGIGFLLVAWQLLRVRREAPGVVRLAAVLLGVLLAQMLVGEIQYRNALPWGLVLVHVTLGATIWALTVAVAHTLWRPPLPLVAPATERSTAVREPLHSG